MTAPIYQTKTWQYANNSQIRTPASTNDSAAHFMWFIKALLMGDIPLVDFDNNAIAGGSVQGKWTMYSSCDGTTAGAADDGVDRLGGATYNLTKFVRAAPGVAHSWMVLKSPAGMGPFYLCLDFSGAQVYNGKISMSKSPFSTGGTTTAKPTAANEDLSPDCNWADAAIITQNRKRAALCTDGNFFALMGIDGQARFHTFITGATLAETRTGDAHNFWVIHDANTNIPGVPFLSSPTIVGRSAVAGALTSKNVAWLSAVSAGASVWDIIPGLDATDGGLGNSAAFIVTGTPNSLRGRLVDFSMAGTGLVSCIIGDLVPISGIGEFMRAGKMWVPSNGVFQVM